MKKRGVKVMVFGTFDVIHPGHLHFLRQAKALGDFLVVSVSRDRNAKAIKGHKPTFNESERLEIVRSLSMVDRALLGGKGDYIEHVLSERPHIVALGYDQVAYTDELRRDVAKGKLKVKIVGLAAYKPNRFKSTVYKNSIKSKGIK